MRFYAVRFVHPISPKAADKSPNTYAVSEACMLDNRTLGAELRRLGLLPAGVRVSSFRRHNSGRTVVFPGKGSMWHSIILCPIESPIGYYGFGPNTPLRVALERWTDNAPTTRWISTSWGAMLLEPALRSNTALYAQAKADYQKALTKALTGSVS